MITLPDFRLEKVIFLEAVKVVGSETAQQAQEIKPPPISQAKITPDLLPRAEIRSTSPM
jgi:hypothetical protein